MISRQGKQEKRIRIISKAIGRSIKKALDSLKEKTIIRKEIKLTPVKIKKIAWEESSKTKRLWS